LSGVLTNHSGYELERVTILVHAPTTAANFSQGSIYVFSVPDWKKGATLDLATLKYDTVGSTTNPVDLGEVLSAMGQLKSEKANLHIGGGPALTQEQSELGNKYSEDLLPLFLDARNVEPLQLMRGEARAEPVRTLVRGVDRTKALYGAGGMIVARTKGGKEKAMVQSPVPITVNGRKEAGQGSVLFAWTLPLDPWWRPK
jgi:hypothetical protein